MNNFARNKVKIIDTAIKRNSNRGIGFKMFVLMMAFIFLIFTAIFISFNFSVGEYVRRETNHQLEKALNEVTSLNFRVPSVNTVNGVLGILRMRDLSKEEIQQYAKNPLFYNLIYRGVIQHLRTSDIDAEVNIVLYNNDEYARLYPDENYNNSSLFQNLTEIDVLVDSLNLNSITLPNTPYRTSTSYGNYYLTLVDLEDLFGLSGLSMALYLNTEKYDVFIDNINLTLLIILIVATVFSVVCAVFISKNISKPVQSLCTFADEIGRGNFKQKDYKFHDREFIDLNNRMNETAKKLEKNDEDQKTFFQNVSHELRTPLMSVKGYAEGIKYGVFPTEPQMQDATDIIISETDRLNDLVSDLIYISKLDSFKKIENKITVNLFVLVRECAEKLKGLLINTHKKININEPDDDIYIECDESSLIRAILNVMANCVQYAKSTVDVSIYADNGDRVMLSVKDDGNGIAESDLPNIFKRFYKGSAGKHGIGLAITKAIVEQHGGEIYAVNSDTGAEFIFKFTKV